MGNLGIFLPLEIVPLTRTMIDQRWVQISEYLKDPNIYNTENYVSIGQIEKVINQIILDLLVKSIIKRHFENNKPPLFFKTGFITLIDKNVSCSSRSSNLAGDKKGGQKSMRGKKADNGNKKKDSEEKSSSDSIFTYLGEEATKELTRLKELKSKSKRKEPQRQSKSKRPRYCREEVIENRRIRDKGIIVDEDLVPKLENKMFPMKNIKGSQQFSCPWEDCGRQFSQLGLVKRHYLTHQKVKPYSCGNAKCNYKSDRKDNVKYHMKMYCPHKK